MGSKHTFKNDTSTLAVKQKLQAVRWHLAINSYQLSHGNSSAKRYCRNEMRETSTDMHDLIKQKNSGNVISGLIGKLPFIFVKQLNKNNISGLAILYNMFLLLIIY